MRIQQCSIETALILPCRRLPDASNASMHAPGDGQLLHSMHATYVRTHPPAGGAAACCGERVRERECPRNSKLLALLALKREAGAARA